MTRLYDINSLIIFDIKISVVIFFSIYIRVNLARMPHAISRPGTPGSSMGANQCVDIDTLCPPDIRCRRYGPSPLGSANNSGHDPFVQMDLVPLLSPVGVVNRAIAALLLSPVPGQLSG